MAEAMPELKCAWVSSEATKYACTHWHYSKCLPAGKLFKVGVWEDSRFVGVVIFSRGANNNIGKPFGLEQTECVELTRIALRDHRHFVSEIMMQALRKLKETNPGLRLVVSYADPEQGHVGGIYQATNWIYTGTTLPQRLYLINGRLYHARAIQSRKPKNMTESQFVKLRWKNAKRVMDMGKYKYLMPLDRKMRKQIAPLAKPYPKKAVEDAQAKEESGG
jgi:hypothetical protein